MSWGGCVIMADACKVLWNCVIPLELLISERMIILFRTSYLHSWRNSSLQSVEVVVWQLVTAGDSSLGWSQQPPAVTAASTDQARWVTVYCDIRVTSAVTTVECDTEWLSLEWHHTESHQSLSLVSAPECDSVCRGQYHWGLRILSSVVTRVSHDGWSSPATLLSLHSHITDNTQLWRRQSETSENIVIGESSNGEKINVETLQACDGKLKISFEGNEKV